VSNDLEVLAFRKSFVARFTDPDSFSSYLARSILDTLHHTPAMSIRPVPGPVLLALLNKNIDSLNPADRLTASHELSQIGVRYWVQVTHLSVSSAKKSVPLTFLPGIGGQKPAGGGTSEKCVVFFTVEIRKIPGLEPMYTFTVQSTAEADLYSAASALQKAVDGAAQKTAVHLRGY
jgi:hypothetical protein